MAGIKKIGSVVISGYYGFGNAGDELILQSIIEQIRNQKPNADITVFSARPHETEERFNVKAVHRWHPWSWFRPLWTAETFILGGGGLLQESTSGRNHFYYLGQLVLAKLLSCRTETRALGVDPVERWWNRLWTRFVFDFFVNYPSVRDADSQRALETVGIQGRIWRTPDPVFRLSLPARSSPARERRTIAWAVTPWNERPGWEHDLATLMRGVSQELNVDNELLVFFPTQDQTLAQRLSELSDGKVTLRLWEKPEQLVSWIQEYDLIIGMRYHALVLAALAGKPFIGWGVQRKVRTLCYDFNQPMWTFERGWDPDAVYRQILDAWKRRESLSERSRAQMARALQASPSNTETARIFVAQV